MTTPRRGGKAPPRRRQPAAAAAAIHGVGVDILRVERIAKVWQRHGERFALKILGPEERKAFDPNANPVRQLAMAFAGKEAFVKALGTGFHGIGYAEAGVLREASGKPVLVFVAKLRARLKRLGIGAAHLSLSDEGGLVCAFVVLERR